MLIKQIVNYTIHDSLFDIVVTFNSYTTNILWLNFLYFIDGLSWSICDTSSILCIALYQSLVGGCGKFAKKNLSSKTV